MEEKTHITITPDQSSLYSGQSFIISDPTPKCFILQPGGKMLVEIYPDGMLTFGPAFTTKDEASLEFWKLLAEALPGFKAMLLKEKDEAKHV